MPAMKVLPLSYFAHSDTLGIARDLLGKFLLTEFEGQRTGGTIVETEAYLGREDRACHAWGGRRTARTEVMFGPPARAYVYLCYGIHHLFNIVTWTEGEPHAILVRAIEPVEGLEHMLNRRNKSKVDRSLTGGPGAMAAALGLHRDHTGLPVTRGAIQVLDQGLNLKEGEILASPRVGVAYAGEDALLPYRFRAKDSKWTSPAK